LREHEPQSRHSEDVKISAEEKEYYKLLKWYARLLAPFYDAVTAILSKLRDKVVDFTGAPVKSRILDVATGTGKQAFAFAKKGYVVVGIELSKDMLNVAISKNRYDNVNFQITDATKLPFEDNVFDVSCVSFALHDMILTIREKALKEMVRVTKPKGTIIIVDYFVRLYEPFYPEFIKSNFEALIRMSGIDINEELSVLLGAGRMIKGIKRVSVWNS